MREPAAMRAMRGLAAACLAAACLAGCSGLPSVAPWQKGELARPEMRFDTTLESRMTEQVYGSREAASGGTGVGGGGCGCN
jgi:hypothetical protein